MNNPATIKARVRKIVAHRLRINPAMIHDNSRLVHDLGADSLGVIEISMDLEDAFDLAISDEDAEENKTFGQVVDWLVRNISSAT